MRQYQSAVLGFARDFPSATLTISVILVLLYDSSSV